MGINKLFSPESELPYMSDYGSMQVSNVQQKTSINVDEEGTVLITLTNVNVIALSFNVPIPDVEFVVDRPFIAVISNRDKNVPYVVAKISDPEY